ncbi:class A beta-lactamase-related serine hydrolase [Caproiciproducens sp. NJN-50]|uniref:serine hydrolase domain-containing protein n=1 Tax=Acutalibacteraceae TaxID=3082771 RepID=UPI000FFDFD84|nr:MULTISPECIES: serine hydrolase domain-containing protein [Acutalibacteraceae]QAT50054.1 class A beta-lactamase-related serine hydrolase [Caproiciproducens sp. NJN-50]
MTSVEMDALFSQYGRATPGCSVAVRQDGRTRYRKAFGMASLAYGVPNTPETLFHAASVSKQFTAFCILLLAEDGRISLQDTIRDYLPDFPDLGADVTLWQLLHHAGGLREQWDLFTLSGHSMEDLATPGNLMHLLYGQRGLNFKPGTRYLYCNSGFTVLAWILHAVTGKTLREFAAERIFQPLGMSRTFFRDDHAEVTPGRASSYGYDGRRGRYSEMAMTFDVTGSTGLNTTAEDCVRWLEHLRRPGLCRPETMQAMLQRFSLASGEEIPYGCGIQAVKYHGLDVYQHSGANAGYRAAVLTVPSLKLDIAVLSNYRFSFPMVKAYQLLDGISGLSSTPVCEKPQVPAQAGWYVSENYHSLRLEKAGKDLLLEQDGMTWTYERAAEGGCYAAENGNFLSCEAAGTLSLWSAGTHTGYRRVFSQPLGEFAARRISGLYYSRELMTAYRLSIQKDRLLLFHPSAGELVFVKTGENCYLCENRDNLNLAADESGDRFFLNTDRSRNLEFRKASME